MTAQRAALAKLKQAAVTLGAALSAILTRMVRSSVIEELGEDYVRTARAKGLSERKVLFKHVLKNGLIPVVTGVMVSLPSEPTTVTIERPPVLVIAEFGT